MVLIIPQSEKADPPPYTPRDPSPLAPLPQQSPQPSSSTTSPGAPPPGAAPSLPTRTSSDGSSHPRNPNLLQPSARNYLRVVQVDQDIIGHWTINPALPQSASPSSDGAPHPGQPAGANVYFQTERARIEATVAWIGPSANGEGLPRAKVEALNKRGDISIINTTRPRGLPIHVKAVSLRKGDVRICAPSDFYGILLLRIPASTDWKTRIGLASEIKSQVSCTRETAITRKGKNKMQQAFLLDQADSEEHTLVEILIGSDLEVADFNRAFNAGPGSLDLIEVEIRGEGTRIMILSAEDAALGHEPFPSQHEDEMKNAARNADKSWRVPGVNQGGFTVSFRDRSNRPANHAGGIEIVIDEPPRWMGSFMKMLGKHGDKDRDKDRDKDKKGCKTGGASSNSSVSQNWGWVTSPQSSTVTLVTPEERPGPPPFPGIGAPGSLSPRSSYDHHRRLSSTSHEDHRDLLVTPPPRSQRSASFGGSSEATFASISPPIPPIPPRRPTPAPPNQNTPSATPGSPYVYPSVSTSPPPQHPLRSPSDPKVGPRHPDLARGVPRIISPPLGSPPPSSKRVPYSRHGHSYSMDDLRDAIDGGSGGREQSTSPVEFSGNDGVGGRQGSSRQRVWQEQQASRVPAGGGLSFGRDMGPYRYPYGTMPLPFVSASSSRGGNTRGRWDPDLTRERWNSSRNHHHGQRNGQALPPPPPQHPSAQQTRMSPPPLPISSSRSPGPGSPKNRYPGHPQRPSTSPTTATNHQRGASNPWPASSSSSSSSPPPAASSAWAQWQHRGATIPQPSSPSPSTNSGGSTASGRDGRKRLVKMKNRNQSTPDLRGGGILKRK